jgi:hypothetical protein
MDDQRAIANSRNAIGGNYIPCMWIFEIEGHADILAKKRTLSKDKSAQ